MIEKFSDSKSLENNTTENDLNKQLEIGTCLSSNSSANSSSSCSGEIHFKAALNKHDLIEIEIKLRNSRKAYECEELGENQAFLDDICYLLDGLSSKYKLGDRCLCAIKLAESCLSSEFRMNLRLSSEYINTIFNSLNDSVNYQVSLLLVFIIE